MKTKELTGWSYNKNIEDFEKGQDALRIFVRTPDYFLDINASIVKVVVELPEKKIELTESQFDEAVGHVDARSEFLFVPVIGDLLKQKLFGKGE